jgi:hypothetical protein
MLALMVVHLGLLLHELGLNLLLLEHHVHVGRLLLFGLFKLNSIAWSEVHEGYIYPANNLLSPWHSSRIHGSGIAYHANIIVVGLVREVCCGSRCIVEASSIVRGDHVRERVVLMGEIYYAFPRMGRVGLHVSSHSGQLV